MCARACVYHMYVNAHVFVHLSLCMYADLWVSVLAHVCACVRVCEVYE